jgi:alpha-L-fucosidase
MKFALFLTFLLPALSFSQQTTWFADAKLGIFIHWGMYAADGTSESWAFHNKTVPYAQYMSQMNKFTAENYHPAAWAQLIKESGAKYCVITTKHHDGLSLYNTQLKTPQAP